MACFNFNFHHQWATTSCQILQNFILDALWCLLCRMNRCFELFLFFIFFNINFYTDASRVLELSDRFLDVSKEGMWYIKFYAPWCGHCKKIEPIWNQVAQALHSYPVRVGRVDCTRYTAVATEYRVKGFPTILFIKGENVFTFSGERTREEMVDFALRLAGPSVSQLEKYEDFLAIKNRIPVFFVYIGDPDTEIRKKYEQVADVFQTTNYFYHASPECIKREITEGISWPQVAVFKDGIYNFAELPEIEDANTTLSNWVMKERFVLFTRISHGNFQQLLGSGKYLVMAVMEENKIGSVTAEMDRFRTMLKTVITTHKEKYYDLFQFGWLGQPELANSIAMMMLPLPSLLIVNSTTYQYYIPDDDPKQLSADVIANFLDQIVNNTVPAYGGDSFVVQIYRAYFEAKTSLSDMWRGNPVLTAVLFGLPLGFLSLICYSICCSDILEASEEEEILERERKHVKRE